MVIDKIYYEDLLKALNKLNIKPLVKEFKIRDDYHPESFRYLLQIIDLSEIEEFLVKEELDKIRKSRIIDLDFELEDMEDST